MFTTVPTQVLLRRSHFPTPAPAPAPATDPKTAPTHLLVKKKRTDSPPRVFDMAPLRARVRAVPNISLLLEKKTHSSLNIGHVFYSTLICFFARITL